MFYFRIKEFYSILCIFGKTWLYIVLHDFNLTYYSSIILGSFSIPLFPKLCWHIGLTPNPNSCANWNYSFISRVTWFTLADRILPFLFASICGPHVRPVFCILSLRSYQITMTVTLTTSLPSCSQREEKVHLRVQSKQHHIHAVKGPSSITRYNNSIEL